MLSSTTEWPASADAPQTPRTRSAEEIRAWIVTELARALRVEPGSINTAGPIFALGVDSVVAISTTGAMAEWLGRDLPVTLVLDHPSIDAIAAALGHTEQQAIVPTGIIVLKAGGTRTPLFCFPGAGGHSATFAPIAHAVGTDHPCYGLIVPGIHGERAPLKRVEEIAAAMLQLIRQIQPTGPYQLAGYSFGGLLAYEAAQQLRAAGEVVSLLAIYDTITAQGRVFRPRWQKLGFHAFLLATRSGRSQYIRSQLKWRREKRGALQGHRRRGGTAHERRHQIPAEIELADRQAAMAYSPTPYAGSIVLFRPVRAAEDVFFKIQRANGWEALAPGRVTVIELPGNHFSMLDPGNARTAADLLRPYLSGT